jgi:hypothetical protein
MNRSGFIRKLMRFILLLLLATIVFILGNKTVVANDCTGCPVNGSCTGQSDCSGIKK